MCGCETGEAWPTQIRTRQGEGKFLRWRQSGCLSSPLCDMITKRFQGGGEAEMIHICQYVNFDGKLETTVISSCFLCEDWWYNIQVWQLFPLYHVEIDFVYIFNVRMYINFRYVGLWGSSSINIRVCLVNKHFRTG